MQAADKRFTIFLRKLSKKGFYPVLVYVSEMGELYYSDILKAARASRIVESSSQINSVLRTLTDFGLLEQKMITNQRPVRTRYNVTKEGRVILQLLKQLEHEID